MVEQHIPHTWGPLNDKDMASTGWATEDVRYEEGVAKKTQTTRRKMVQLKLNVQTVKTTLLFQDLAMYTKKKRNTWIINEIWLF